MFTDRNSIAAALELINYDEFDIRFEERSLFAAAIIVAQALDRLTERIGTLNEIVEQRLA